MRDITKIVSVNNFCITCSQCCMFFSNSITDSRRDSLTVLESIVWFCWILSAKLNILSFIGFSDRKKINKTSHYIG